MRTYWFWYTTGTSRREGHIQAASHAEFYSTLPGFLKKHGGVIDKKALVYWQEHGTIPPEPPQEHPALVPKWVVGTTDDGADYLTVEREPFAPEEAAIANRIGLPRIDHFREPADFEHE